jgi:hypothetical protein
MDSFGSEEVPANEIEDTGLSGSFAVAFAE